MVPVLGILSESSPNEHDIIAAREIPKSGKHINEANLVGFFFLSCSFPFAREHLAIQRNYTKMKNRNEYIQADK
jgi:hypothetical protein